MGMAGGSAPQGWLVPSSCLFSLPNVSCSVCRRLFNFAGWPSGLWAFPVYFSTTFLLVFWCSDEAYGGWAVARFGCSPTNHVFFDRRGVAALNKIEHSSILLFRRNE